MHKILILCLILNLDSVLPTPHLYRKSAENVNAVQINLSEELENLVNAIGSLTDIYLQIQDTIAYVYSFLHSNAGVPGSDVSKLVSRIVKDAEEVETQLKNCIELTEFLEGVINDGDAMLNIRKLVANLKTSLKVTKIVDEIKYVNVDTKLHEAVESKLEIWLKESMGFVSKFSEQLPGLLYENLPLDKVSDLLGSYLQTTLSKSDKMNNSTLGKQGMRIVTQFSVKVLRLVTQVFGSMFEGNSESIFGFVTKNTHDILITHTEL